MNSQQHDILEYTEQNEKRQSCDHYARDTTYR